MWYGFNDCDYGLFMLMIEFFFFFLLQKSKLQKRVSGLEPLDFHNMLKCTKVSKNQKKDSVFYFWQVPRQLPAKI